MAFHKSNKIGLGKPRVVSAQKGQPTVIPAEIDLSVVTLAAGDILGMAPVPGGMELVDAMIDMDQVDSGGTPTWEFEAGFVNSEQDDLIGGYELMATSTSGRSAGGAVVRCDSSGGLRGGASPGERLVGIKVTRAPATQAAGGKIRMTVTCVPT